MPSSKIHPILFPAPRRYPHTVGDGGQLFDIPPQYTPGLPQIITRPGDGRPPPGVDAIIPHLTMTPAEYAGPQESLRPRRVAFREFKTIAHSIRTNTPAA